MKPVGSEMRSHGMGVKGACLVEQSTHVPSFTQFKFFFVKTSLYLIIICVSKPSSWCYCVAPASRIFQKLKEPLISNVKKCCLLVQRSTRLLWKVVKAIGKIFPSLQNLSQSSSVSVSTNCPWNFEHTWKKEKAGEGFISGYLDVYIVTRASLYGSIYHHL